MLYVNVALYITLTHIYHQILDDWTSFVLDEVVVLSNLGKTAVGGEEEDTLVQDAPGDISQQDLWESS